MPATSFPEHASRTPVHLAIVAAVALAIAVSGMNFPKTEPSHRSATPSALAPSYAGRISVEEQSATDMLRHEAWTVATFGESPLPGDSDVDAVAAAAGSDAARPRR